MNTTVITNIGQLVTLDSSILPADKAGLSSSDGLGIIEDAALLMDDGQIVWVGLEKDLGWDWLDKYDVLNAKKNVVMPGFIDSHTHLVFAGSRHDEFELRLNGVTYTEIASKGGGILSTVQSTREADFELLYKLSQERIKRIQKFGVTTVEIKSGYGLSLESEMKQLKVIKMLQDTSNIDIIPTFMAAHALSPEFSDFDTYTDHICKDMIPVVASEKLAKFCDVFCESGYFNIAQSRRILTTAREYGLELKLHADEFSNFYATALGLELDVASVDHLVFMDSAAIACLKKSNTVATLLPGVSFFLNTPKANARALIDGGATVAIATDFNPGSTMSENIHLTMVLACYTLKMSPAEVIKGVTINAARALKLNDRGVIKPGMRADLAFFNIPSYKYLFYHYGVNHLSRLIRAGKDVDLS